jgi:hypothetical protein
MSSELLQTIIVSAIALVAAVLVVWRIAKPYFTRSTTTAPCARCESGDKCAPAAPSEKLIQIQRPTR